MKIIFVFLSFLPYLAFAGGGYDPNAGGYDPLSEPPQVKKPTNPNAVGFKDYLIGETNIEDLNVRRKFKCYGDLCSLESGGHESIANSDISLLLLKFSNKKLVTITIKTRVQDFGNIAKAMIGKYGKPTKTTTTTKQNAFGAKFVATDLAWEKTGASILASEMEDIHNSSILFISDSELELFRKTREKPDI